MNRESTSNETGNTSGNAALSDGALAVFAFAAYHQLESGEQVSGIVIHDRAGHQADGKAVAELTERGLASVENDRIVLTRQGEAFLAQVIETLRQAASGQSS